MARSGAQRKQQRKPQTRSRGGSTRTRTPSEFAAVEAEMFFPKLRRQAKWMFVFLALVFGVGFVVFGVGSGGGAGIGDILNGGSSSSGPSESHARDKIAKNPADAAAWRELATALTNQNKTDEAIPALERYVQLRPHDSDALKELAGYYEGRATNLRNDATAVQANLNETTGGGVFGVSPSSKLGQALGMGRIDNEVTTLANTKLREDYGGIQASYTRAARLYESAAALHPEDTLLRLHLADVAYQARLIPLAVASYEKFIKAAPQDQQVPYAKQQLAILRAQLKPIAPHKSR